MRMKLTEQEHTQASTRTSNGPPNVLLMFLVPLLAIGSILCIVFVISNFIEGSDSISAFLCIFAAPAQVALLVFLIDSKMLGSYESSWGTACASFFISCLITGIILAAIGTQQQNEIENTREEFMSEQGYENLEKQGYESMENRYENMENRGRSTYYAEKDGKEYLLIVDEMKDDGEMKFEVTPFENGNEEALN